MGKRKKKQIKLESQVKVLVTQSCLTSDALLQHLPSYLGFSYLGVGYLLIAALPDLQRGIAPLGPPAPAQPRLLGRGFGPLGHCPWPWLWLVK